MEQKLKTMNYFNNNHAPTNMEHLKSHSQQEHSIKTNRILFRQQ